MKIEDLINFDKAGAINRLKMTRRTENPILVFPDAWNNPSYAAFLYEVFLKLSDKFPQEDWTPLLSMPGYAASPLGNPSKPIRADVPPLARKVLRALAADVFRHMIPGTFSIKKTSTVSFPYFTSNLDKKKAIVEFWRGNYETIFSMILEGDSISLAKLMIPIVYAGTMGVRLQSDSFKVIEHTTHAITKWLWKSRHATLTDGLTVEVDKTLPDDFQQFPFMSRKRARQVYQIAAVVNSVLIPIFRSCFNYMHEEYGFTYAFTTIEAMLKSFSPALKIHGKMDSKEYDKHLWFNLRSDIINGFKDGGLSEAGALHMHATQEAAYFMAPDYPPIDRYIWSHDPLTVLKNIGHHDMGMPSGYAGVAVCDKLVLPSLFIAALIELGYHKDSIDDYKLILKGGSPNIQFKNAGDDNYIRFINEDLRDKFYEKISSYGMDAEPEDPKNISFLGNRITFDGQFSQSFPNPVNGVANILSPEFSILTERRSHWGFGMKEREKYYLTHPLWSTIWEEVDRIFRKHYNYSITAYINKPEIESNQMPTAGEYANYADIQFIMNPDVINYKIPEASVSKELRDKYYLTYDADTTKEFINIFTGR